MGGGSRVNVACRYIEIALERLTYECSEMIEWFFLHEAQYEEMAAYLCWRSGSSVQPSHRTVTSQLPRVLTMDAKTQRPKDREGAISALNVAVEALNLIKEVASVTPAKAAFGSVSVLLTMIRVCLALLCNDGLQVHK